MPQSNQTNQYRPSDDTLTLEYVALQPGNYPPNTDLTPYKGTNLTAEQLLDYKPLNPFGIGDMHSLVYIYPQGTIEVVGKVYCWNKLVKPGIYSPFEKLRYIDDTEVVPVKSKDYLSHHAVYNHTLRIPNKYMEKDDNGQLDVIKYRYVSFEEQITADNGTKVYPVPILNGRLTLYPDGTFKTEGVAVKSTDKSLVDGYGYLGDHANYSSVQTYFDTITLNDLDPKSVYEVLEVNSDGSVTYGPVASNQNVVTSYWLPIPVGLIPVNDGRITINEEGSIAIQGLVITDKGYRITQPRFNYRDLFIRTPDGDLKENEAYIDKSAMYNPRLQPLTGNNDNPIVLNIADINNPKSIYRYHMDNDSFTFTIIGPTKYHVEFRAMKGWDNFTSQLPNPQQTFDDVWNDWHVTSNRNTPRDIDKTYYPWTTRGKIRIGNKWKYPIGRFNEVGVFDSYNTIDHTLFWNPTDLVFRMVHTASSGFQYVNNLLPREQQPNYISYPRLDLELVHDNNGRYVEQSTEVSTGIPAGNLFVPYVSQGIDVMSEVRFQRVNGITYIETVGKVIWKQHDEYFLLKPGRAVLGYNWPDIKAKDGKFESLFTVNGYFTDEPIYIQTTTDRHHIQNTVTNISTLQRQEPGVFSLVERRLTHCLTDYEKRLISNCQAQYQRYDVVEGFKVVLVLDYYLNTSYSHRDTGIALDYDTFRYNEVIPSFFSAEKMFVRPLAGPDTRLTYIYDKFKGTYTPLADTVFECRANEHNFKYYLLYRSRYTNYRNDSVRHIAYIGKHEPTAKRQEINTSFGYTEKYGNIILMGETGHESKPTINTKERIKFDEPLVVNVSKPNDNPLTIYYRSSEELVKQAHSVEFTTGTNHRFTIPVAMNSSKKEIQYQIWYENPFDELYSIKVVTVYRESITRPIRLASASLISTRTTRIYGTGHPGLDVRIRRTNEADPDSVVIARVKPDGTWVGEIPFKLDHKLTYKVFTVDPEGSRMEDTFTPYLHPDDVEIIVPPTPPAPEPESEPEPPVVPEPPKPQPPPVVPKPEPEEPPPATPGPPPEPLPPLDPDEGKIGNELNQGTNNYSPLVMEDIIKPAVDIITPVPNFHLNKYVKEAGIPSEVYTPWKKRGVDMEWFDFDYTCGDSSVSFFTDGSITVSGRVLYRGLYTPSNSQSVSKVTDIQVLPAEFSHFIPINNTGSITMVDGVVKITGGVIGRPMKWDVGLGKFIVQNQPYVPDNKARLTKVVVRERMYGTTKIHRTLFQIDNIREDMLDRLRIVSIYLDNLSNDVNLVDYKHEVITRTGTGKANDFRPDSTEPDGVDIGLLYLTCDLSPVGLSLGEFTSNDVYGKPHDGKAISITDTYNPVAPYSRPVTLVGYNIAFCTHPTNPNDTSNNHLLYLQSPILVTQFVQNKRG